MGAFKKTHFLVELFPAQMNYFLGVDIGSGNVKLSLIDESGNIVQLDTEKISTGPRAAVSTLITRLGQGFNLDQIVATGVSGSGKTAIPNSREMMRLPMKMAKPG